MLTKAEVIDKLKGMETGEIADRIVNLDEQRISLEQKRQIDASVLASLNKP